MNIPKSRGPTAADEEVYRYYSRVISLTLNALDDGAPSGMPPTEFIEIRLGALGFDNSEDWLRFTDQDAFRFACCPLQLKDDYARNRFIERDRKQRHAWLEYMGREDNPIIFEYRLQFEHDEDSEPGKIKGKHYPEYKLTIAGLIRDIIADCPIGTHHTILKKAVKAHAQNYLDRFNGTSKRGRKKRETSTEARLNTSFSHLAKAFHQEELRGGHEAAIRRLQAACPPELKAVYQEAFGAKNSADPVQCPHCGKSIDSSTYDGFTKSENFPPQNGSNSLKNNPVGEKVELSDFPPEIDVEEPYVLSSINTYASPVESLPERGDTFSEPFLDQDASPGLSHEEFLAETWPVTEIHWRDKPITEFQRTRLLEAGEINLPETRGKASDRIKELFEAGAFSTFLSLSQIQSYDPKGGGRGRNQRYCCPFEGKTLIDEHRDLSVDRTTGEYHCFACGAAGVLREHQGYAGQAAIVFPAPMAKPEPEKKSDKWKERFAKAKPVASTPGAKYLEGRGVPVEKATDAGVRYGLWPKQGNDGLEWFNAVQFPFFNMAGELVAVAARAIEGKTMRTAGDLSQGVFLTGPDVLKSERIAIVEAPIDGMVLAAVGLDVIALGGTSIREEWLPSALEGKDIALATDNDPPDKFGKRAGDECAAKFSALLPTARRLRPMGAKDWSEIAEYQGLDAVAEQVMDATECAPEMEAQQ